MSRFISLTINLFNTYSINCHSDASKHASKLQMQFHAASCIKLTQTEMQFTKFKQAIKYIYTHWAEFE